MDSIISSYDVCSFEVSILEMRSRWELNLFVSLNLYAFLIIFFLNRSMLIVFIEGLELMKEILCAYLAWKDTCVLFEQMQGNVFLFTFVCNIFER